MLGIDLEKADRGDGSDLRLLASDLGRALSQLVLRTDVSGMPLEWIDYKEAARLYHQEQVAYTCGSPLFKLYGGALAVNDETLRSTLEFGSERTLEQDPTFAFLKHSQDCSQGEIVPAQIRLSVTA
jgi:hypothetical protein